MKTMWQEIEEILPAHEDPPCDASDEEKIRWDERRVIEEVVAGIFDNIPRGNHVSEDTIKLGRRLVEWRIEDEAEKRVMRRLIQEVHDLHRWLGIDR